LSHDNAVKAAAKFEGRAFVIDSKNLSTGGGLSVLYAVQLAKEGLDAEEIVAKITEYIPKVRASFIIDDLEFLHKGGRCSGLVVKIARLLKLKPTIVVRDGAMTQGKKHKGRLDKNVTKYIDEALEGVDYDPSVVFVTYTEESEPTLIEQMKLHLEKNYKFDKIIVTTAGATVTAHCGKNTMGVLFAVK